MENEQSFYELVDFNVSTNGRYIAAGVMQAGEERYYVSCYGDTLDEAVIRTISILTHTPFAVTDFPGSGCMEPRDLAQQLVYAANGVYQQNVH